MAKKKKTKAQKKGIMEDILIRLDQKVLDLHVHKRDLRKRMQKISQNIGKAEENKNQFQDKISKIIDLEESLFEEIKEIKNKMAAIDKKINNIHQMESDLIRS